MLLLAAAHAQGQGIWDRRIDDDARRETFTLTSRKPNYLLVTSMSSPNQGPYEFTGSADRLDSEHRLNAELAWSFPIARRLRGLVQWYNGYGENLIDYNFNTHRIGVGVLLTDWW